MVSGIGTTVIRDRRNHKTLIVDLFFIIILLVLTTLVVVAFYQNHPQPEPLADSWSYLYVVDHILKYGQVTNFGGSLAILSSLYWSTSLQRQVSVVCRIPILQKVISTPIQYFLPNQSLSGMMLHWPGLSHASSSFVIRGSFSSSLYQSSSHHSRHSMKSHVSLPTVLLALC